MLFKMKVENTTSEDLVLDMFERQTVIGGSETIDNDFIDYLANLGSTGFSRKIFKQSFVCELQNINKLRIQHDLSLENGILKIESSEETKTFAVNSAVFTGFYWDFENLNISHRPNETVNVSFEYPLDFIMSVTDPKVKGNLYLDGLYNPFASLSFILMGEKVVDGLVIADYIDNIEEYKQLTASKVANNHKLKKIRIVSNSNEQLLQPFIFCFKDIYGKIEHRTIPMSEDLKSSTSRGVLDFNFEKPLDFDQKTFIKYKILANLSATILFTIV